MFTQTHFDIGEPEQRDGQRVVPVYGMYTDPNNGHEINLGERFLADSIEHAQRYVSLVG